MLNAFALTRAFPKMLTITLIGSALTLNQTHLQAYPQGTSNVEISVDSRISAIHNANHFLLHSSSSIELRHSLLKHMFSNDNCLTIKTQVI